MSINRFKLKLISPAFIAGADKNHPEMRASSVRGQVRYWLRAIIGAQNPDLDNLREKESAIFGSTDRGSTVAVRVYRDRPTEFRKHAMLPHKARDGEKSYQAALNAGQLWDLELVTRPGVPMPPEAIQALMVWSLLGGLGRRSRRMFGAVEIMPKADADVDWYPAPQSPDELVKTIKDLLKSVADGQAYPSKDIPDFPTLNPAHAWVMVGKEAFGDYEEAVVALFKLLRNDEFRLKEATFGGIIPRRSSPLIAQVRRIGKDNYYPILTAICSKPESKIDWKHLKRFMEQAKDVFNGETVFGGGR